MINYNTTTLGRVINFSRRALIRMMVAQDVSILKNSEKTYLYTYE